MVRKLILVISALGLPLITACGSQAGDRCAASIQCEGGNDKDVNACIALANGAEEAAAAYDCSDSYNKLVDCLDTTSVCQNKHYMNSCDAQNKAVRACTDAASGR